MELREINLDEWTLLGEGGNGKTYVNSQEPDRVLKINRSGLNSLEAVGREYEVSRAVNAMGVSSPAMHEMVKVGEAYATVSELVRNKKSLARICADDPSRIGEMARLLASEGLKMHSTPCDTSFFPSRRQQLSKAFEKVRFIGRRCRSALKAFAETIPDATTCVHGDFNMGNLILSGDKPYWIDLDRFAYGNPMFDIGHFYMICRVYAPMRQVQDIFHLTEAQLGLFWDAFAKAYTGKEDHADFDRSAARFACLTIVLRYIFCEPSFLEKFFFAFNIRRLYKNMF